MEPAAEPAAEPAPSAAEPAPPSRRGRRAAGPPLADATNAAPPASPLADATNAAPPASPLADATNAAPPVAAVPGDGVAAVDQGGAARLRRVRGRRVRGDRGRRDAAGLLSRDAQGAFPRDAQGARLLRKEVTTYLPHHPRTSVCFCAPARALWSGPPPQPLVQLRVLHKQHRSRAPDRPQLRTVVPHMARQVNPTFPARARGLRGRANAAGPVTYNISSLPSSGKYLL